MAQADSQPAAPLLSTAPVPIKAQLIGPVANGGVLPGATVTFTWNAGRNASAYRLSIGSTEDGTDLYNASQNLTLTQNVTLPTDGRELFVTLQTSLDGQWVVSKSTLTAAGTGAPTAAQLTSPADQSVLTSNTATFTWDAGTGVTEYWLSLGTSPAATNLYTASQGSHLTVTLAVPTDGSPL